MELSQPQPQPRPVNGGSSQAKKPTHDFLSLYTHNTVQDPRPLPGNYLRTHDFLQPLERIGKNNTNNGEQIAERSDIEKLPSTSSSSSVEHVLPGGIGTYTIRHISNFDQRAPKTEQSVYTVVQAGNVEKNIEISKTHSSSNFVGPGAFTLWDESTPKEMEVMANKRTTKGQVLRAGESLIRQQWSSDRPLQTCSSSSSPFVHRNTTNPARFNSSPPPPPPPPPPSGSSKRKNQQQQQQQQQSNCSFMEMMKSGGVGKENEQDDENNNYDEDDFGRSRGHSSSSLIDGKGGSGDQRANTPRSKHSATEQRRRSKINDRFQILRDLVPQNDQKRDKASFLLEVIDYIKYLQEKVNRYETSYHGWNQEPTKLTPWRNGHALGISVVDPSQAIASSPDPALVFTGKFDVNNMTANPTMFIDAQNTVEPEPIISSANKTVELGGKALPIPIPLQSNLISSFVRNGGLAQPSQRPMSDAENTSSQPQPQPHMWQSGQCANESPMASVALNEQEELTIEGGTISIAGTYSQGLLHNLTQALQSSGVDLAQASISVQVDLGKRAINRLTKLASGTKDHEEPTSNRAMTHTRVESSGEDSDRAPKRLRTEQC